MEFPRVSRKLPLRDHPYTVNKADVLTWLPKECSYDSDIWNVGEWLGRADRKLNFNLKFFDIATTDLKDAIKTLILYSRMTKATSASTCASIALAAASLSKRIKNKSLGDISNADLKASTPSIRHRKGMAAIAKHLRLAHGLALIYSAPQTSKAKHGKKGTDEGRRTVLIPDDVLIDLLNLNGRAELLPIDKLLIPAVALNVPCGYRVTELISLRHDCAHRDEGQLYITGIAKKGGKPVSKPIAPDLADMAQSAFEAIHAMTQRGREVAKNWANSDEPDWRSVTTDPQAILYFSQKILAKWTSDPSHRLVNPNAAWHRERGWIDILGERKKFSTDDATRKHLKLSPNTFYSLKRQQEDARAGRPYNVGSPKKRNALFRDRRVCDKFTLFRLMGYKTGQQYHSEEIRALIDEALDCQIAGISLPPPEFDPIIESKFKRSRPVHSRNSRGDPVLFVDEALFVTVLYEASNLSENPNEFQIVTKEMFSQWLCGIPGRPSVFERFKIIDPRTGKVASFQSHDIKRWLETQLHRGGLSNALIDALAGRRDKKSNSHYNQMLNVELRDFVKEGIHVSQITGVLTDIINSEQITRSQADAILSSRLRHINRLPFGLCLRDLALQACPHHMSCLSSPCATADGSIKRGICEHLVVDLRDPEQRRGLEEQRKSAQGNLDFMLEDDELSRSPQVEHFECIVESVGMILGDK